ncbi:hypothetical protein HOLleu_35883 [Holothuria leucospilota]|uniref:Uncharacterized protein n=1 Tax=Holothuria leucospilota TaxID=206669 RepID=A0A9Q1BD81_HOLLE|nr:hypothetical protein HOLleu_35883 [Holothuria leucospilota]
MDHIQRTYNQTAKYVLGLKKKNQIPWISPKSLKIVDERKSIKIKMDSSKSCRIKEMLHSEYKVKDKEVKASMRNDERKWLENLANEAQMAAENGQMKTITDEEGKKARWKDHYEEILNRDIPLNPVEIGHENIEELDTINTNLITKDEIKWAIKKLKNGKAGGVDQIATELLKADILTTTENLHN